MWHKLAVHAENRWAVWPQRLIEVSVENPSPSQRRNRQNSHPGSIGTQGISVHTTHRTVALDANWRACAVSAVDSRLTRAGLSANRREESVDIGGAAVRRFDEGHVADVEIHLQPASGDGLLGGQVVT